MNESLTDTTTQSELYHDLVTSIRAGESLTWAQLRGLIRFSQFSENDKALGVWALDTLQRNLGADWLTRAGAPGQDIGSFLFAATHQPNFFVELIELALSFSELERTEGIAKLKRDLSSDVTFDRFWHTRACLLLARLAHSSGHGVAFERIIEGYTSSADVVIENIDNMSIRFEVFHMSLSEDLRRGMEDSDRIGRELEQIARTNHVLIEGHWECMPDSETLESLLRELGELAATVASTGEPRKIERAELAMWISPSQRGHGALNNYSGPPVTSDSLRRSLGKLQGKLLQTQKSGANWIYAQFDDFFWQSFPWANEPLRKKFELLYPYLVELLDMSPWCHGVLLTSGITTALLSRNEETVEIPEKGYALRRSFPPGGLRARETLIMARNPDFDSARESACLMELMAIEAGWFEEALSKHGLHYEGLGSGQQNESSGD